LGPDADVDENERVRYSLVLETFPRPFTQFRLGVRLGESIPQDDLGNADRAFAEWHLFF